MRPKMIKIPKCTDFSTFYETFVQCSGDFMNQNVGKVHQRMNVFSNKVVWGDKCSFLKKCHNDPKIFEKYIYFSDFQRNFLF